MIYHIIDIYDDGFSGHCAVVQNNLVFIKPTLMSQTIKYPKIARRIEFWHSLVKNSIKRQQLYNDNEVLNKKKASKSQDKHSTSYPAANWTTMAWHIYRCTKRRKIEQGFLTCEVANRNSSITLNMMRKLVTTILPFLMNIHVFFFYISRSFC